MNEVEVIPPAELKNLVEMDTRDIADAPVVFQMLFEGRDHAEIAKELKMERTGCTRKIHRLLNTREFQNALMAEWVKRYQAMNVEDARLAFKQLTRLVSQGITRRFEGNETVKLTERRELVTVHIRDYERQIEEELERALPTNSPQKPVDTTPATRQTSRIPSSELP